MSYILDALRKSERERERGAVPVLRTTLPVSGGGRRAWRGLAAGFMLIVSAAAAAWFAGPRVLDEARRVSTLLAGLGGATDASDAVPDSPSPAPAGADGTPGRDVDDRAAAPASSSPGDEREPARNHDPATTPPAGVQDLTLNVVSYSDVPERRFAMIDQRIVRETDTVAGGILVKQIRPDGVILAVGGDEVLLRPE